MSGGLGDRQWDGGFTLMASDGGGNAGGVSKLKNRIVAWKSGGVFLNRS
jgi:hypothetical protein